MDHDLAQQRQGRLQLLPDPYRQSFAGGVVEPVDVIEIVVVETVVKRLERRLDIGEIHHPAGVRIEFSADVQFDPERMSVQTRAFMAGRNIGKPMRGFEGEDLEDVHDRLCGSQAARCAACGPGQMESGGMGAIEQAV